MDPKTNLDSPEGSPDDGGAGRQPMRDGRKDAELQRRWTKELKASEKELAKFVQQGTQVIQKYLDIRDATGVVDSDGRYKVNLFWSNTQVIKSNLYSKPPKVDVHRTFKDQNDDVARVAATIIERILNHGMEMDGSDFDTAAQLATEDYLLPGMGQMWLRYEVETETMELPSQPDPITGQPTPPQQFEQIAREDALTEYVYWKDFRYSPCRTWADCRWVAKRVFMARSQAGKRFGEAIAKLLPTGTSSGNRRARAADSIGPQNSPWDQIEIWEIWCKTDRKVYWFCPGYESIVDVKDDPLGLPEFFPCPKPLMANTTTSNLLARADYVMAQDQYEQIDELTTRITYLTKACRMVGVYSSKETAIARVFQEGMENQMIPVQDWAPFAERGGVKGAMDFIPIETAAAVLEKLTTQREVITQKMYEVLGIGDIMRGATDPNETLGAQKIKAQFGSTRLQAKQEDIARWACEAQRIKAAIICLHWQPETILKRSNIENSIDAQFAQQAVQLLKQGHGDLPFRINIEADTLSNKDWAQENEQRGEALSSMAEFLTAAGPIIAQAPQATPMFLEMLKWRMSGVKAASEIETVLDQAIEEASKPAEDKPDPKAEGEAMKDKADAESKRASSVKSLSDAAAGGFHEPANAVLMEMGLPPADPMHVMAANQPPAPIGGAGASPPEGGGPGAQASDPGPLPPPNGGLPPGMPMNGTPAPMGA